MRASLAVPVGSFTVAVLVSLLAGPAHQANARRSPQALSGPCICDVTCRLEFEEDDVRFNRVALKNNPIGPTVNGLRAAAILRNDCFRSAGPATQAALRVPIFRGVNAIRDGQAEAFVVDARILTGVRCVCVVPGDEFLGPFGANVEINFCVAILRFLPQDATPAETAHEDGHVRISKAYSEIIFCPFISQCVKEALCRDHFDSCREAENRARILVRRCMERLQVITPADAFHDRYHDLLRIGNPPDRAASLVIDEMRNR